MSYTVQNCGTCVNKDLAENESPCKHCSVLFGTENKSQWAKFNQEDDYKGCDSCAYESLSDTIFPCNVCSVIDHGKISYLVNKNTQELNADTQPKPVKNANPAIWACVIQDMAARDILGASRYGTRLQAGNGRDMLKDAYEEALDLACYLRGTIFERDGK